MLAFARFSSRPLPCAGAAVRSFRSSGVSTGASVSLTQTAVHVPSAFPPPAGFPQPSTSASIGAPLFQLKKLAPVGVNIHVKCDEADPSMTTKDRLAVAALDWGEQHGQLSSGQTVVEASRGNSGLGLATVCAQRGYNLVIVAPETSSNEWRRLMRFLGAQVVVVGNPNLKAQELATHNGWFLTSEEAQSEPWSWVHTQALGRGIIKALREVEPDYFVTAHRTAGLLQGVGELLRLHSPKTRIVVCKPDSFPSAEYEAHYGPHPSWPRKLLDEWTSVSPKVIDLAVKQNYVDEVIPIAGQDAADAAQELAKSEGIFTGIGGGALTAGALQVAQQAPAGSSVLMMLLDSSGWLPNMSLVSGVSGDMNVDELRLTKPSAHGSKDVERFALLDGHL